MKTRPMLMSTPMAEACFNKTKTQTRREKGFNEINDNPDHFVYFGNSKEMDIPREAKKYDENVYYGFQLVNSNMHTWVLTCPYGNPGDIIWVRETYRYTDFLGIDDENNGYIYKASENGREWESSDESWKWKPSLHMPKLAARTFLKIISVRPERLHDINESDAINEGVIYNDAKIVIDMKVLNLYKDYTDNTGGFLAARDSFCSLWVAINGKQSWIDNPWVWRIEFEKVDKPVNF